MTLSDEQKRRYVAAIIYSTHVQGPLNDDDVYEALDAILVQERLPRPDLARWYELEESYSRFERSSPTPGPVVHP
jgi:hypothetical protein